MADLGEAAVPGAVDAQAGACVGHVRLRVSDLDRAIAFYRDFLGVPFNPVHEGKAAFIGAGGYRHHIGLNIRDREGASPPPGHTGLHHAAFPYPDRASVVAVFMRVNASGIPFDGAAHHGVSTAVYLRDPDENGVELYDDLPDAQWQRDADGNLTMRNDRFSIDDFVAEMEAGRD
jgi:catechol 2,3-dioxygenase